MDVNKHGLVMGTAVKAFDIYKQGQKCGFEPKMAKILIEKGVWAPPGMKIGLVEDKKGGKDNAILSTRQFNPAKQPDDEVVPGSATDALREEYRKATGKEPDARWGATRLAGEIDKAKEAAAKADDAPAEGDEQADAAE